MDIRRGTKKGIGSTSSSVGSRRRPSTAAASYRRSTAVDLRLGVEGVGGRPPSSVPRCHAGSRPRSRRSRCPAPAGAASPRRPPAPRRRRSRSRTGPPCGRGPTPHRGRAGQLGAARPDARFGRPWARRRRPGRSVPPRRGRCARRWPPRTARTDARCPRRCRCRGRSSPRRRCPAWGARRRPGSPAGPPGSPSPGGPGGTSAGAAQHVAAECVEVEGELAHALAGVEEHRHACGPAQAADVRGGVHEALARRDVGQGHEPHPTPGESLLQPGEVEPPVRPVRHHLQLGPRAPTDLQHGDGVAAVGRARREDHLSWLVVVAIEGLSPGLGGAVRSATPPGPRPQSAHVPAGLLQGIGGLLGGAVAPEHGLPSEVGYPTSRTGARQADPALLRKVWPSTAGVSGGYGDRVPAEGGLASSMHLPYAILTYG